VPSHPDYSVPGGHDHRVLVLHALAALAGLVVPRILVRWSIKRRRRHSGNTLNGLALAVAGVVCCRQS
jgi:hypothetical protein